MSDTSSTPRLPEAEQVAELKQQLHSTTLELQWAYLKIQVLEQRLRLQRIQKYGPASEKPVVAKYSDHLPLYRQSAILEREAGLEISRATLDGWMMRVGELLVPIVTGMSRELVKGSYIQADETRSLCRPPHLRLDIR